MKPYFVEFLLYTALALSSEAIFTGLGDVYHRWRAGLPFDRKLPCSTQLWSIAVYGLSATFAFNVITAIFPRFYRAAWWERGLVYVFGTYAFEYAWGWILEKTTGACPWRYRNSRHALLRYTKPEYFGLWFFFGFALEWVHLTALPRLL